MVIEKGNYEEFKRCTFRLLDYARVSNVVEAIHTWSLLAQPTFTLTGEQFEGSRVILRFSYEFDGDIALADVFSVCAGRAANTDTLVCELWSDGKLVYYSAGPNKGWSGNESRFRGKRSRSGTVAFLLDVPYPCHEPDREPTFVGDAIGAPERLHHALDSR